MSGEKRRITIHLRNNQDITVFLKKDASTLLVDQIYDVFSGELSDNCIEVISDTDIGREVILLRADEVIYVKTQEEDDE